jgi:hypothetical protein
MPLQGEAKVLYQRAYMRRRRKGLPTLAQRPSAVPAPAKAEPPPLMPRLRACSFCGEIASNERILIEAEHRHSIHICNLCIAEAAALIETERPK